MKTKKHNQRRRRGMAAMEAVLTAAITIPMAGFMWHLLAKALEQFFFLIGTVVGSAYT
jgi:hypothetical protein